MSKQTDQALRIQARQNDLLDAVSNNDLPAGFTVGYIGNLDRHNDDRSWMVFRSAPGHYAETIGGFPTDQRGKLMPFIRSIQFAHNMEAA